MAIVERGGRAGRGGLTFIEIEEYCSEQAAHPRSREEGQELAGTGNDQAALNTIAPYSSQLEMRVSPPGSKLENLFIRALTLLNLM